MSHGRSSSNGDIANDALRCWTYNTTEGDVKINELTVIKQSGITVMSVL